MSLQDAKDEKKIFSHNGNDYGFVQDVAEDKTYTKIMVPSSKDGYRAGKHPSRLIVASELADLYTVLKTIDQTFHLQQIVKLPGVHGLESSSFAKATIPAKKPVKEQPPGLKMRFQPIGFSSRNLGKIESNSSSDGGTICSEFYVLFVIPPQTVKSLIYGSRFMVYGLVYGSSESSKKFSDTNKQIFGF